VTRKDLPFMTKKELLGSALTLSGLGAGGAGLTQAMDGGSWLVAVVLFALAVVLLVGGYRLLLIRTDADPDVGLAPDGEGGA
jgi:membrane protein implicated in regulation of membrane protease activity